jgi:hypothetical protein
MKITLQKTSRSPERRKKFQKHEEKSRGLTQPTNLTPSILKIFKHSPENMTHFEAQCG